MKTRILFVTMVLLFSGLFTSKAQTLESKYGLDSTQTILNASLYIEMVKQKKNILKHYHNGDMFIIMLLPIRSLLILMV
jgi:hypothetical protein